MSNEKLKLNIYTVNTVYSSKTWAMLNNISSTSNDDAIMAVAERMYNIQNNCVRKHLINDVKCSKSEFADIIRYNYDAACNWIRCVTERLLRYEASTKQ